MQKIDRLNISATVLSLAAFFFIAYLTNYVGLFNEIDQNVIINVHSFSVAHSLIIPKFITDLGYGPNIAILLILISAVLAAYSKYKEALLINMTTNSAYFASGFFKEVFKRVRPALEYQMTQVDGYSFPSGHALVSVCFYGAIIYIIFRLIKNNLLKYILMSILAVLILAVGLSRIYLGVHYPTDVLGGFFLGLFIIFFWITLYYKCK